MVIDLMFNECGLALAQQLGQIYKYEENVLMDTSSRGGGGVP